MILYHGGSVAVPNPLPVSPEKNRPLDFGSGFYTTTSLEQARRWIKIRAEQNKAFGKFHTAEALKHLKYIGTVE